MKVLQLSVVAVATAMAIGGCAQIDTAMDRVSGLVGTKSNLVAAEQPASTDDKDLDALTNFQTAAGPTPELHPAAVYIEDLGEQVIAAMAD
jgi:hypothetical protein